MTGTTSAGHMKEDLAGLDLPLPQDIIDAIESIAE